MANIKGLTIDGNIMSNQGTSGGAGGVEKIYYSEDGAHDYVNLNINDCSKYWGLLILFEDDNSINYSEIIPIEDYLSENMSYSFYDRNDPTLLWDCLIAKYENILGGVLINGSHTTDGHIVSSYETLGIRGIWGLLK